MHLVIIGNQYISYLSIAVLTIIKMDVNENDPLLIFLRSHHQCIKGSVDEFYVWLVKYENIESMMALKEAVSDDDYLNDTMRIGDRSYGVKGFKLSTFKRVVQDYVEEDNGDTNKKRAVQQVCLYCVHI